MLVVLTAGLGGLVDADEDNDWRLWRGPSLDNHVPDGQVDAIPSEWSATSNVAWQSPIPGRGHATPIVVDDQVFVLTHEPEQRVIAMLRYQLADGKLLGRVVLHQNVVPPRYLHQKNTCASSTPSSDGRGVFTVAQVNDAIIATGLTLDGKIVWQQDVTPYRGGGGWFGYGASPLLLADQLIVAVDVDNADGGLISLDRRTGRRLWKADRTESTSYSSPILATVAGLPQILISGGYRVASYDPDTGRQLWSVPATSRTTCGTMVWTDSMVFASGSYPESGTFGIRVGDGRATVAWENKIKCYEQSMLIVDDHVIGVADSGVVYCWRCDNGQEKWKARLTGPFSASPLLVGDRIFAMNERGTTFVFAADTEHYQPIAENQLGDSSFASPIVAGGKLLLRTASESRGQRVETLTAIAE